jgi:ribosomal protein L9
VVNEYPELYQKYSEISKDRMDQLLSTLKINVENEKGRTLYGSMNQNEIARTLDMSESLVKEYIAIH